MFENGRRGIRLSEPEQFSVTPPMLRTKHDVIFHELHLYIIYGLLLITALIAAAAIIAWELHGLVSLIRWLRA